MNFRKHSGRMLRHLFSIPFIYAMLFPIVMLDVTIELYHRVCFSLYGLPYLVRKNYIKIDRHKLKYLNWYEKINCTYCSYANGFFAYCVAIAAETEKYWCGIKHQARPGFHEPAHHKTFLKYGDEKTFNKKFGYPKRK